MTRPRVACRRGPAAGRVASAVFLVCAVIVGTTAPIAAGGLPSITFDPGSGPVGTVVRVDARGCDRLEGALFLEQPRAMALGSFGVFPGSTASFTIATPSIGSIPGPDWRAFAMADCRTPGGGQVFGCAAYRLRAPGLPSGPPTRLTVARDLGATGGGSPSERAICRSPLLYVMAPITESLNLALINSVTSVLAALLGAGAPPPPSVPITTPTTAKKRASPSSTPTTSPPETTTTLPCPIVQGCQ